MSERDQDQGLGDEGWIVGGGGGCLLRLSQPRDSTVKAKTERRAGLWDWTPERAWGIPARDNQHRRFTRLMEELRRAEKGRDRNALGYVLEKIDAALRAHFATEERRMEIADFPNLRERQESHRAFQSRLAGYRERFLAGQEIGKPLLKDLKVYLANHMRDEDRRSAPNSLRVAKRGWMERLMRALFPNGGMD